MAQDKKPPRKTSARKKVKKKATKKVKGKPVPDSPQQRKPDNIMTAPSSARPSLGDFLSQLDQGLTRGTRAVLGSTELLAAARRGRTRGLMTTRTLLFALSTASTDRAATGIDRLLIDDLTLDFSRIVATPEFMQELQRGFEEKLIPAPPNDDLVSQVVSYDFTSAPDLPISGCDFQRCARY